jgi:outer membrane protein
MSVRRRAVAAIAGACVLCLCFSAVQGSAFAQPSASGSAPSGSTVAQAAPSQPAPSQSALPQGPGSTAAQVGPQVAALTLEAAGRQALAHNPQVAAAEQTVVAARASVVTARAGLAPSIALSGTGIYGTTGSSSTSTSSAAQGLIAPAGTPNTTGALSITGTLPIFDSGKTAAAVAQADAAVALAEATLRQTQQDISLTTATDFFAVLKAQRLTTVRAAQLAQAQAQLAQAEAQFRAGTAAQADVIQAQAQVAQAQVDLLAARNQVDTSKVALRGVLAVDVQAPLELQEPEAPPSAVSLTADAAVQEALRSRAEIAAAVASVQSNQGALDLAVITAGLQVSVGVNTSYVPYSTNSLASNSTSYGVTATVSLPIFDSGKGQAGITAARANLNASQAKLEQARLTVRQDAYQAYLAAVQGAATVEATAAAQRAASEALRVAEGRYQAGVATIVEVTTSRATAAQAEVNAVNARYDYQAALSTLLHALGRPVVGGTL